MMQTLIKRSTRITNTLPRRYFINTLGIKNITEADVDARINKSEQTYVHPETLVFDHLGRFLIFDCMSH